MRLGGVGLGLAGGARLAVAETSPAGAAADGEGEAVRLGSRRMVGRIKGEEKE
jgi:hypothetical protein